jgi:peptide/nickel transport system substrate-binding protein
VYRGLGAPQWGPVNPLTPIYDDEATQKYPYDLTEAARILDKMGLVDLDGDGVRNITNEFLSNAGVDATSLPDSQRNEQFRELEFAYKTFTGSAVIEQSSIVILNDLESLGLDISFQPIDFNTLINNLFTGQFEAAMMGFAVGLDPVENVNTWRSDGNLHFWHPSAFDAPYDWEARIDEILTNLNTTFDPEDRQALYSAFQRIMSENLPLIYTVNNRFLYAYASNLRNTDRFEPLLGGFPTILAFSDILWLEN